MEQSDTQREERVTTGRRTDESERMMVDARDGAGTHADSLGTSPAPEDGNQTTTPPGNGALDEPALAAGLDRLEQAGGGH